jgi:FMN-dependent NADH-azoreductase
VRVAALNGSPRGAEGATGAMIKAFLSGAESAGAEVAEIVLAEREVRQCRGCHHCWSSGGACVHDDGMAGIIEELGAAGLIVLATPVFFFNISGTLKTFIDRLTAVGSPHAPEPSAGTAAARKPSLAVLACCGLDDRSQFEVVSLWSRGFARMMGMDLAIEAYAETGKALLDDSPSEGPAAFLDALRKAGACAAGREALPEDLARSLERGTRRG